MRGLQTRKMVVLAAALSLMCKTALSLGVNRPGRGNGEARFHQSLW